MSYDQGSNLRFSIEESIWLKKGHEIADILAISLEPNIVVEEHGEYVSVRGTLQLEGEFQSKDQQNVQEDSTIDSFFSNQMSYRSIHEVSVNEEGTAEFKHRFPVDITIPLSRVNNLDEIFVTVESFDYAIPNHHCLQLTADLAISGIQEEAKKTQPTYETVDTVEEEIRNEEDEPLEDEEVEEYLQNDDYYEEEFNHETTHTAPLFEVEVRKEEADILPFNQEVEEERNQDVDPQVPQIEVKSNIHALNPKEEEEQPFSSLKNLSEQHINIQPRKEEREEIAAQEEAAVEEIEPSASKNEAPPESHREENALYLTKILAREEEEFAKLRMCIAQPGETLSTIAERYEVSLSNLLRINSLEKEEIKEGQILYIPQSAGK
ncbi:stage VI sporulation protein D [Bacillus taeanensis]|uniref:Stage VI sporulation protein D n=1 Tax=Bacillus taeanensis TaxID=273032 RepID=A0A366Y3K0_9BACI|nr:stage VI sporulation protein D [Bacillus taeanensis]RBW71579.1 stage VI sporulation protein D [Bacillus taeanensis]